MDAPNHIPLSKLLPWTAGGVGLAALENKYLGENLPPELKNINLAIGGTTGALMSMPSSAARIAALSGIPLKEGLLFGVGGMEKFRKQQEDLVGTNLATARINKDTAQIAKGDAGGRKALAAAFLIPALLGGGGMAYMAYQAAQKRKRQKDTVLAQKGTANGRQKVRIDVPAKSFPPSFWQSLVNVDDTPNARTQVLQRNGEGDEPVRSGTKRSAAELVKIAGDTGLNIPGLLGTLLYESTGIPSFQRTGQETARGFNSLSEGDMGNSGRYGLSAAANAALGLVALRLGVAPVAGKLLGPARLATWAQRGIPGSKFLFRNSFGNRPDVLSRLNTLRSGSGTLLDEAAVRRSTGLPATGTWNQAIEQRHAYDPTRFAWRNPKPARLDQPLSGMFNRFLTEGRSNPKTRFGHAMRAGQYGINRAVNTGYRGAQFLRRWPNAAMTIAGTYPAAQGVLRDQYTDTMRTRDLADSLPRWSENQGYHGMPISSMAVNLMSGLGGPNANAPFVGQLHR